MAKGGSAGPGFLAGMIVGGLIGAALGLLLAPRSGRETRAALRERGIELPQQVEDAFSTAKETVGDIRVVGKSFVAEKRSQIVEAIGEGRRAAVQAREDLEQEFARRAAGKPASEADGTA